MKGRGDQDFENRGAYRAECPSATLINGFENILLEMANNKIPSEISGISNSLHNVYIFGITAIDSIHELKAAKSLS